MNNANLSELARIIESESVKRNVSVDELIDLLILYIKESFPHSQKLG